MQTPTQCRISIFPEDMPVRVRTPHEVRPVEELDAWQKSALWCPPRPSPRLPRNQGIWSGLIPKEYGICEHRRGWVTTVAGYTGRGVQQGIRAGSAPAAGAQRSANPDALAERITSASGLAVPAGLAARAPSALRSTPVECADDLEYWLELLVVASVNGVSLEGIIDRLCREEDGTLVIADFKTSIKVTHETMAAYWRQLST